MNRFIKFWSFKRLKNKHIIGSTILIALVVAPVICALILSDSMIDAMSNKYIYLSSGHLSVSTNEIIPTNKYIKYSNQVCSGYAMMYSKDQTSTLYIKGVGDDYFNEERLSNITFIDKKSIPDSNLKGITISEYTANILELSVGDRVAMMIVPDLAGKSMRPVLVYIEGIYTTGYEAIDSNLSFISFDYAKTLFNSDNSVSTELILYDSDKIDVVKTEILNNYPVSSWMSSNYSVFSNFVTSKQVIFLILLIVITMAGFYTSSAARLANEDCMRDISILKMIGASDRIIYLSSLVTMLLSNAIGIIIGLTLGFIIAFNFSPVLKLLSNSKFEGFRYYLIDFKPIVNWSSIIICIFVLFLVSFFSVLVVLRRTKKITPIQLFIDN